MKTLTFCLNKLCSFGDYMLNFKVIDADKLNKRAKFLLTLHVFLFILFIRKAVFNRHTLCQLKLAVVYTIYTMLHYIIHKLFIHWTFLSILSKYLFKSILRVHPLCTKLHFLLQRIIFGILTTRLLKKRVTKL